MHPNTLQYIMSHASIIMTLGYYAHGSFSSVKAKIGRLSA
ncbi:transposase [Lactococcus chungangensis CAU 28 = DSM 22330]|uniref:Transposase n=2 Tax=Pseudolactococcus chungangensis TaxID=451457 RepID=A0ABX4I847_9LACT|nr:transposase [Lactococcus chungangensis CAU 28 = DSM 22330]